MPPQPPLTLVELISWDVRQTGGAEGLLRELNESLFRLTPVPLRVHLIYRGDREGRVYQQSFSNGVLVYHELPWRNRTSVFAVPRRIMDFQRELRRITNEEHVDVLHLHDLVGVDAKPVAWWTCRRLGIPWVASSEWTMSWNPLSPKVFIETATAWLFTRGAKGIIGLTEGALRGLGGPKLFCACGINADFFHPEKGNSSAFRHRHNVPDKSALLFYPARFERRKGQTILVGVAEALRRVPGMADFIFILMGRIGEPGYFNRLEKLVRKRSLGNYFRFLPPGGAEEVRDGLAAADLMVFPSFREGLGIIALEAMSMRKPVVYSDIPGLNEVMRPGVTGINIPPGNAERMAEGIVKLLKDPDLRESMGRAGRLCVEKNWRAQETVLKHLTLYQSLVGKAIAR